MLNWASRFSIFCFLDNGGYQMAPQHYECLLAAGVQQSVQAGPHQWRHIDALLQKKPWLFGHLSYEAAHHLYGLSPKADVIDFPLFYFFEPQWVVYLQGTALHVEGADAEAIARSILETPPLQPQSFRPLSIRPQLSREAYLDIIAKLQQHIRRGDCYEINFCQAFFAEAAQLPPVELYRRLVQLSPNPYAALYRHHDQYLICASPERFLAKKGAQLLTQPIKGTARRSPDKLEDEQQKAALLHSPKERAENVMVVDLVRNDLSKVCQEGTVQVAELFGIYPFPQVHQMISTVSGTLKDHITFSGILEATFPMGSMTGAPKQRVMQLIDQYEPVARGIFSGTVGYIRPDGDFDFNVVIRSIMYNTATGKLAYQAGSGITIYCDAEAEWEECTLKAAAIKKVLAP